MLWQGKQFFCCRGLEMPPRVMLNFYIGICSRIWKSNFGNFWRNQKDNEKCDCSKKLAVKIEVFSSLKMREFLFPFLYLNLKTPDMELLIEVHREFLFCFSKKLTMYLKVPNSHLCFINPETV